MLFYSIRNDVMNDNIYNCVSQIISKVLNVPIDIVQQEQCLKEGLMLNSLLYIKVIAEIEREFNIEFDNEEMYLDVSIDLNGLCKIVQTHLVSAK